MSTRYNRHPLTGDRLQATVEIYLDNVVVDRYGNILDYDVAYNRDIDPDIVREGVRNALNLEQPERIHVYDTYDTPLPEDLQEAVLPSAKDVQSLGEHLHQPRS